MKLFLRILVLLLLPAFAKAQDNQEYLDSLHMALRNATNDTIRMEINLELGGFYAQTARDSSFFYGDRAMQLARKLNQKLDEASSLNLMGLALLYFGNYPQSLESLMQALHIAEDPASEKNDRDPATSRTSRLRTLVYTHMFLGDLYGETGNINRQISSYRETIRLAGSINDSILQGDGCMQLGPAYINLNKLDSALYFEQKALYLFSNKNPYWEGAVFKHIGEIYFRKGNIDLARNALFKAAQISEVQDNGLSLGPSYISLGNLYRSEKKPDSSLVFAYKALEAFKRLNDPYGIAIADSLLSSIYNGQNKKDSSFTYLKLATALKDSLHAAKINRLNEFQNIGFIEQMRLKELQAEKIETETKVKTYAMLVGIGVFMLIAFLLYRNNRSRQKANAVLEEKNRELEIQTALEKVRVVAMGMKEPDDMLDVCKTISIQMGSLGVNEIRNIQTAIFYPEKGTYMNYQYYAKHDKAITTDTSYTDHQIPKDFATQMLRGKDEFFVSHITGEKVKDWIAYQKTTNVFIDTFLEKATSLNYYWYSLGAVALGISTYSPLTGDDIDLFKRFVKVFELAYRRFLDIEQAQAQTRDAQIETALEKVRSRTMAMQRSDELSETAAVLFHEFKKLGNEDLIQATVATYNVEEGQMEFYATSWAGGGEQTSRPFNLSIEEPSLLKPLFTAWKEQKKSTVIDLTGKQLEDWLNYRSTNTGVKVTSEDTLGRRVITAAFFTKGHLTISSPLPLQEDTLKILERFAAVFDGTYTRFNDLQKAEAHAVQAEEDLIKLQTEKKRAEDALNELQATQKQLIQSEKMASLGELTAGIAHEIQNPLNFVNNFSDVSNELIDEMNQELDKGGIEEARAIANDLKQNLEKISHHGKRADGIVKGMLQHSQNTGGVKEETDLNELADEYLRLAYHGLRAKDKSFNATLKTEFDPGIGKINIIPQDIGRVILNLINNAFYAVGERYKAEGLGFEPTVSLTTKKIRDKVEIRVTDNGNGIPQKVLDKIFQPFFTTKPTGQGTGLGLSLAYDIVKAHGGEIRVETLSAGQAGKYVEGLPAEASAEAGSTFVIQLPVV